MSKLQIKHRHSGAVVEFEAKDIAAIPIATDGKFRLHRCDVVAEKDLTEIGLVPAAPAVAAE